MLVRTVCERISYVATVDETYRCNSSAVYTVCARINIRNYIRARGIGHSRTA